MGKLTVDECKRIIMQGKKQLTAAEQRIAELEGEQGSRWFELFGTPERAARTLTYSTPICIDCAIRDGCEKKTCIIDKYDTMLEWLRGESE